MTSNVGDAVFRDVPDPAQWAGGLRMALRLAAAAVLGGVLGFERGSRGRPAGLRTHRLVALGSAFVVAAAERSGLPPHDLARVVQGLVVGIGFLGDPPRRGPATP